MPVRDLISFGSARILMMCGVNKYGIFTCVPSPLDVGSTPSYALTKTARSPPSTIKDEKERLIIEHHGAIRQTQLVELTVVYEARDHSTSNAKPNTSPPYV